MRWFVHILSKWEHIAACKTASWLQGQTLLRPKAWMGSARRVFLGQFLGLQERWHAQTAEESGGGGATGEP